MDVLNQQLPEFCRNSSRLKQSSHGFVSLERSFSAKSAVPKRGSFELKGKTKSYKCEAGVTRSFCIDCGSQIFSTAEGAPGLMLIKTGVLDEQPNIDPTMVCWTDSKPNWLEIKHPDIKFEKNPG